MDADTRHQLKQNELAEALRQLWNFTDRRTTAWLVVILAVALGYAGYKFWRWQQRAGVIGAYRTLTTAGANVTDASLGDAPLAQLRRLIADNPQPALVALSRLQLAQGLEARSRGADGAAKLSEAERQYHAILEIPEAPDHLKAAALYRLGLLHETRRDFSKARETYTRLSEEARFEGAPFVELAAMRLELLDDLTVPIEFAPGVKPLPAMQPASQPASQPTAADTLGSLLKPPAPPTTQPSEPQQP